MNIDDKEKEQLEEEIQNVMNSLLDSLIPQMSKIAKMYKVLYDSLQEEGFTPEQALAVICSWKMQK